MGVNKIKICIADDHHIMVDGLKEVLQVSGEYEVIGEAYNGIEMLELLTNLHPDVILMDINMPGMDGIQCTKIVKERYQDIKVLILTMHNERSYVNQLIAAGADGCLLKSKGSHELITAIERVMSNKSYFDSVSDFKEIKKEKEEIKLSEREKEIVKLVSEGKTSTIIAERLCIAEHTVRTHRKNIFKKLGINNTTQLTRYALNHGLL